MDQTLAAGFDVSGVANPGTGDGIGPAGIGRKCGADTGGAASDFG